MTIYPCLNGALIPKDFSEYPIPGKKNMETDLIFLPFRQSTAENLFCRRRKPPLIFCPGKQQKIFPFIPTVSSLCGKIKSICREVLPFFQIKIPYSPVIPLSIIWMWIWNLPCIFFPCLQSIRVKRSFLKQQKIPYGLTLKIILFFP